MYKDFGISEKLENLANDVETELNDIFKHIDEDELYNTKKVLMAFQKYEVSEMHFGSSTGYGEGDVR